MQTDAEKLDATDAKGQATFEKNVHCQTLLMQAIISQADQTANSNLAEVKLLF